MPTERSPAVPPPAPAPETVAAIPAVAPETVAAIPAVGASSQGRPLPYEADAEPVGTEERTGPPLALLVGAAVVVLTIVAVVLLA